MPQRHEVTKVLRFLKQNPNIPGKGINYLKKKLHESGEDEETLKLLSSAHNYLRRKRLSDPMLRNIRRLGRAIAHG
jgi:hypothetical protein